LRHGAEEIEVFADVTCPFTHVGLRRFIAHRDAVGCAIPVLRVRAWPLEIVNHEPMTASKVTPKISALRRAVAPDLFGGFDGATFPASSLPALASVAAASRISAACGERFSIAVRDALFEHGRDIAAPAVLAELRAAHGVGDPTSADASSIDSDFEEGTRRGVVGSPHFFTPNGEFFCPSLDIENVDGELVIAFDRDGFDRFIDAALG
jgi:predicted DsbA family dithiol-disulfide isomerase